jgi:hypothetical protein
MVKGELRICMPLIRKAEDQPEICGKLRVDFPRLIFSLAASLYRQRRNV